MTRVGFTGHQGLTSATRRDVAAAISNVFAQSVEPLIGLTSLAEGSDQVFALAVLAAGGQLHVVIPSQGYEETFATDDARKTYKALLELAATVTTLPFTEPGEDAYLAAGQHLVNHCDTLIAVWDGKPAVGKGGTGDIVTYARNHNIDCRVIWPLEVRRE